MIRYRNVKKEKYKQLMAEAATAAISLYIIINYTRDKTQGTTVQTLQIQHTLYYYNSTIRKLHRARNAQTQYTFIIDINCLFL